MRPISGKIQVKVGTDGYPEDLDVLVEGVTLVGNATGAKIKFLRRIPIDPMTGTTEWGKRSSQDDPKSNSWGGQNVFDVYSDEHGAGARWNSLFRVAVEAARAAGRGYTLIELIIVMAIISILMAIAIPHVSEVAAAHQREHAPQPSFTLRTVIDEYTFDKKKAPQTLQDLVTEGYLRAVPIDPITGNDQPGARSTKIRSPRWIRPSRASSMSAADRT